MSKAVVNNISKHLEFMGYEIDDSVEGQIIATSSSKANITVFIGDDRNFISIRWSGFEELAATSVEFNSALNFVNRNAYCKWVYYILEEGGMDLVIFTSFTGYDKKEFTMLVDAILNDSTTYLQEFADFAIPEV